MSGCVIFVATAHGGAASLLSLSLLLFLLKLLGIEAYPSTVVSRCKRATFGDLLLAVLQSVCYATGLGWDMGQ